VKRRSGNRQAHRRRNPGPKRKRTRATRSSAANHLEELAALTRELSEAREQQIATAEVLRLISRSSFDLQTVLDKLTEAAAGLCEADLAGMVRPKEGAYHWVTTYGFPRDFREYVMTIPLLPGRGTVVGRALQEKQAVQIPDVLQDREYTHRETQERGGYRSVLGVPFLREGNPIGVFFLARTSPLPFIDRQVELVQNFANQAVIAIENARLLSELRESLDQQTATSAVLKVISSSPSQLEPVFNAILENATRICDAAFGNLVLREGAKFRAVAVHGKHGRAEHWRQYPAFDLSDRPGVPLDRAVKTKDVVHIPDLRTDQSYIGKDSRIISLVEVDGARTLLIVPLIKENEVLGAIAIYREAVSRFSDKQIDLVKNFATQAVIAIENARLLNELRESLQQQTATADVLKIISTSPAKLEPVFQSMLAKAVQICEAKFGVLFRCYRGDEFQATAWVGVTPEYQESLQKRRSFRPNSDAPLGRLLSTKDLVHTADESLNPASPAAKYGGARSLIAVPISKEGELVGAFVIYRVEVRPFTEKQIELLRNFAAQAVIAIENARLLDDLNKLNRQLEHRVNDQVNEIERMGRLRRFLPPQVADLIVASGGEKQLESHRREITALFCDLRGFTGFSESSDPEDVMALLRDYHAAIGEIINKYGGTLERYAGDGVMVVFNDPIPVGKPALQAVRMAIDMRAGIGDLIEKWRKLGHDIGFGIGIAHGFATLGTIGFEGRFDYAAIGTVSNVASRLCDEAKPGQILISPRVLMAVEQDITVELVGDFLLKGIRRPMTAYNVIAVKPAN
jgi:GAF domain-containing protein